MVRLNYRAVAYLIDSSDTCRLTGDDIRSDVSDVGLVNRASKRNAVPALAQRAASFNLRPYSTQDIF